MHCNAALYAHLLNHFCADSNGRFHTGYCGLGRQPFSCLDVIIWQLTSTFTNLSVTCAGLQFFLQMLHTSHYLIWCINSVLVGAYPNYNPNSNTNFNHSGLQCHNQDLDFFQKVQVADSLNLQCLLMLFIQEKHVTEKDVICHRKRRYLSQKKDVTILGNDVVITF